MTRRSESKESVNVVAREGVTCTHPARFLLIGTMNPEEGDLRPQLLQTAKLDPGAFDRLLAKAPRGEPPATGRKPEVDVEDPALPPEYDVPQVIGLAGITLAEDVARGRGGEERRGSETPAGDEAVEASGMSLHPADDIGEVSQGIRNRAVVRRLGNNASAEAEFPDWFPGVSWMRRV